MAVLQNRQTQRGQSPHPAFQRDNRHPPQVLLRDGIAVVPVPRALH